MQCLGSTRAAYPTELTGAGLEGRDVRDELNDVALPAPALERLVGRPYPAPTPVYQHLRGGLPLRSLEQSLRRRELLQGSIAGLATGHDHQLVRIRDARHRLLLEVRIGEKEIDGALGRLAMSRAKQQDVRIDPEAIARLRARTNSQPALFASELDKLLDWAGEGGQIRAADVGEQVVDESSEDVYAFFEALGRRDAGETLGRLERLFSGREIRAGKRSFELEDGFPQIFLGMLTDEIRRMLLVRSLLAEPGAPRLDSSFDRYKDRVAPYLDEPLPPFGSPFGGKADGYALFKAAERSSRFTVPELAKALARAADVDVKLKSSAPVLETLTAYVGGVIAGV